MHDNSIAVFCMSLVLFSESRHILSENRFYVPAIKRYNYKKIYVISAGRSLNRMFYQVSQEASEALEIMECMGFPAG